MNIDIRIKEYREVKASDIAPNPRNWRTHPEAQVNALRGVLADVGYAAPVVAYHRADGTLMLIDGHARAELAGDGLIPVVILDVNDDEAAMLLATLDPIGDLAGANAAALDDLLRDVSTDSPAVAAMLSELAEKHGVVDFLEAGDGGDEFDTTPDEQGETRAKLGDLWLIGGKHRLIVGDCTDAAVVARLMGGERADAVITDPPYGVNYDTDYTRFSGSGSISIPAEKRNSHTRIANDEKPFNPSHLMEYKTVILWGSNCYSNHLPIGTTLVWDKRHSNGTKNMLSDAEIGWLNRGHGAYIFSHTWDGVVRASERGKVLHPTQKPVALFEWCLKWIDENVIVFDPYAGSGPVFIAAHRTGRRCYGCEIEPRYADVILRRAEAEGLTIERLEA